ncbi:galactokinase family protein [Demequina sp. NBRC 110057]|uniref:galactokinase n=1 Tax=Demequina sp. NBRC 110057 TaxID=1570346 RepID=UPI000A028934|nr:galactokinase family protein [Demequina sp. NBRC 110057]
MPTAETPALEWAEPWTRGHGEHQVRELFSATFGGEPAGVWSAPGRVMIIGEHADYNGGATLATATPHRLYVAARPRRDFLVRAVEGQAAQLVGPDGVWEADLSDLEPGAAPGWPTYIAAILWTLRERGYDGPGLDIAATSCLPPGGGLAGWAALEAATVQAADGLWGLALSDTQEGRLELAEVCFEAEQRFIGSPFGGTDQHTALRCRDGEAISLDFSRQPPPATRFPLPFREYGLGLLVVKTADVYPIADPLFLARQAECRAAARALGVRWVGQLAEQDDALARVAALADPVLRRRARHLITEIGRVRGIGQALSGLGPAHERFTEIGRLLYRSHASLELDFDVSTPALNRAVDAAYRSGALGARMFGAGRGGSVLALVRRAEAERTAARIQEDLLAAGDPRPAFVLV